MASRLISAISDPLDRDISPEAKPRADIVSSRGSHIADINLEAMVHIV